MYKIVDSSPVLKNKSNGAAHYIHSQSLPSHLIENGVKELRTPQHFLDDKFMHVQLYNTKKNAIEFYH